MSTTVAITRCPTPQSAGKALTELIDLLDKKQLKNILRPGSNILIKPNIVNDMPAESGAITKPQLVEAVVMLVKRYGANPIIGEGQVFGIQGDGFVSCGLKAIAERHKVRLVDLNKEQGIEVALEGRLLEKIKIAKTVLKCDAIISLPVLKTNIAVLATLSLKNMIGIISGFEKHKVHLNGLDGISRSIVDLNKKFKPQICIVDGIIGMEGDGPVHGKPKHLGLLIGGFDPVAVDTACAKIMGLPLKKITYLDMAERENIGSRDFNVKGLAIDEVQAKFDLPRTFKFPLNRVGLNFIEPKFMKLLNDRSYMVIHPEDCTACSYCKRACVGKAITIVNKKAVIDTDKCVKCMCCLEACQTNAPELVGWIKVWNRIIVKQKNKSTI